LAPPDLKVDYDLLEGAHKTLTGLVSEFGDLKASTSGYNGAMGSGTIAGAMDSFAGNWDYHRDKLVGSMKSLDGMITESVKQFMETDKQAAQAILGKDAK
jgi:hypothetical protein